MSSIIRGECLTTNLGVQFRSVDMCQCTRHRHRFDLSHCLFQAETLRLTSASRGKDSTRTKHTLCDSSQ